MISKENFTLCSLLLKTRKEYNVNLELLLNEMDKAPQNSVIVASEVCLTGFDYEHFEAAAAFTLVALPQILEASTNKIIIFTVIEKIEGKFYNSAYALYNQKVIHKQSKHHLFLLGDEQKYFSRGDENEIIVFEIDGIKFAILICFELRFKTLWKKLEGADIIAIPAQWGKPRAEHFQILTKALAIMNECYIVASDANNDDTTALSGVISPFAKVSLNSGLKALYLPYKANEIKKMRRYLNIGIE